MASRDKGTLECGHKLVMTPGQIFLWHNSTFSPQWCSKCKGLKDVKDAPPQFRSARGNSM